MQFLIFVEIFFFVDKILKLLHEQAKRSLRRMTESKVFSVFCNVNIEYSPAPKGGVPIVLFLK